MHIELKKNDPHILTSLTSGNLSESGRREEAIHPKMIVATLLVTAKKENLETTRLSIFRGVSR